MATFTAITKVPVHSKGSGRSTYTFRLTRKFTTARLFDRVVNRLLETYMEGGEDFQTGSVDWDRHWILVGRVALSTDAQGFHYLHTFPTKAVALEYLESIIDPDYSRWQAADDDALDFLEHMASHSRQVTRVIHVPGSSTPVVTATTMDYRGPYDPTGPVPFPKGGVL